MEIKLNEKQVLGTGQLFGSAEACCKHRWQSLHGAVRYQGLEGMESQLPGAAGKGEGEVLDSADSWSMEDVVLKIQTCLSPKCPQCKINIRIHTTIFLVAENIKLFKINFLTLKLGK